MSQQLKKARKVEKRQRFVSVGVVDMKVVRSGATRLVEKAGAVVAVVTGSFVVACVVALVAQAFAG